MDIDKILIYSGTFDPIHFGHLQIAKEVKEELRIEKVVLIPAFMPYHKNTYTNSSFVDRSEMIKIAIKNLNGFEFSDVDKRANSENSYSINTIKLFLKEHNFNNKTSKLKFLIGTDAFEKLNSWYKINDLAKLVEFIVITRPKSNDLDKTIPNLIKTIPDLSFKIISKNFDISSSAIREKIKNGTYPIGYLSPQIYKYILSKKLYL